MSAVPFGRGRPRKPRPLVETTPRICVYDLKMGAAAPLTAFAREEVAVVLNGRPAVLEVVWEPRHLGGDGQRFFLCPACSRKVQHLYVREGEQLTCRRCSGLSYACKHTRSTAVTRARRLRRKLGGSGELLTAPPPRPRQRLAAARYDRLVAELAVAESKIAAMFRDMVVRVRRRRRML